MFKAHELVVKLEKKPKYNRGEEITNVEDRPSPRPPLDRLDIEMLSQEIAKDIVSAYVLIKGVKTFCSMLEHIVVTKVK